MAISFHVYEFFGITPAARSLGAASPYPNDRQICRNQHQIYQSSSRGDLEGGIQVLVSTLALEALILQNLAQVHKTQSWRWRMEVHLEARPEAVAAGDRGIRHPTSAELPSLMSIFEPGFGNAQNQSRSHCPALCHVSKTKATICISMSAVIFSECDVLAMDSIFQSSVFVCDAVC